MEGSLLGLDTALLPVAPVALGPPRPNPIPDTDLLALRSTARQRSVLRPAASDRRTLVALAGEGRRRLMSGEFAESDTLSWRAAALPWAVRHEPDAAMRLLTPVELVRLGGGRGNFLGSEFDAWGGTSVTLPGCLCRQFRPQLSLEDFADRPDYGFLGLFSAELRVRLAELMEAADVPLELSDVMYSMALDELTERPLAADFADWFAIVLAIQRLNLETIDRFIGDLSVSGVLVPVGGTR
jgi:hypothetical protein